jgi:hypothetical protein
VTNTPFTPPGGLTSDDTVFAAPGRWLNGSLIRFYNGSWQTKGGWERLTLQALKGVCRSTLAWTDFSDILAVAFGLHNGLQVWRDNLLYDITPTPWTDGQIDGTGGRGYGTGEYGVGTYGTESATEYYPLTWSLATWGDQLMANPRGRGIYQWDGVSSDVAALVPNAPTQVTYMLVAPQRQCIAFGCNEEVSGTFNPLCIRWSDIEDNTDWSTLPSNNAGEYILESFGRIVTARVMGDYLLVWTSVGLYLGTFVGDPGQTWKFDHIGSNCGSISPGSPLVKNLNAMWIAEDLTFWTYSLGGVPSQVVCPIRSMMVNSVTPGQSDKIIASAVSTFQELGWFYPDSRDGFECSRQLCIGPDGWNRDLLSRTAWIDAGPQSNPIGIDPQGDVYLHEKGNSADGAPITGFIESTDFYLQEAEGGVMINGLWPDFKNQQGALTMTLYLREHPQAVTIRTHGPWTLAPGLEKRSFRASGRIARVRFDFSSSPAFARGGKPEFDVSPIGGR